MVSGRSFGACPTKTRRLTPPAIKTRPSDGRWRSRRHALGSWIRPQRRNSSPGRRSLQKTVAPVLTWEPTGEQHRPSSRRSPCCSPGPRPSGTGPKVPGRGVEQLADAASFESVDPGVVHPPVTEHSPAPSGLAWCTARSRRHRQDSARRRLLLGLTGTTMTRLRHVRAVARKRERADAEHDTIIGAHVASPASSQASLPPTRVADPTAPGAASMLRTRTGKQRACHSEHFHRAHLQLRVRLMRLSMGAPRTHASAVVG